MKSKKYHEVIRLNDLVTEEISKPGRYIGNELGVNPKTWESTDVRWALTYPEIYEVGASNLGHIILYSIINSLPRQLCDRSYLPGNDLGKKLRDQSQPLFAVESHKPLLAFDLLGFSLSYELGATNILEMLDLAKISIHSDQRHDLTLDHPDSAPLIFAGGPTATSNPEPFAAFFDFFALGDGEELLPEIGLVVAEAKNKQLKRSEILKDLAEIPGIYVPSFFKINQNGISIEPKIKSLPNKILRRVANPMPFYAMGLVPNLETIHDRLTIEIRRGCTRGCRFCQPGMLTRPARDVDPNEIISSVETGMKKTGYSDFSLLSLSCSDYLSLPAIGVELRNRLADKNISLQLPSQRIDRFNDDIAHIIGGTRKASLTFAPEAGTQKLRDIVNKGLTDQDLINGIRKAMENGHRKIKLYFMIGLPGEEDEDVIGIATTCKFLQKKCLDLGRLNLNITISNFTPKPHTPFQWHSTSTKELIRRQNLLRKEFNASKGIKVNYTDVRLSAMEDFIGRGDRSLAQVIEAAWKEGAGMDAWFESIDKTYKAWEKAIISFDLQDKYREIEMGNWSKALSLKKEDLKAICSLPLPWDHIDTGIDKEWLAKDLQRALASEVIPDCSFHQCSGCGVCGDDLGHNSIINAIPIPERKPQKSPPSEKVCRIQLRFSKTGYMKYLSHLDLVRLLDRAFRRNELPISFTGGFHPLPRIRFALSLPLGVEGLKELVEIDFTKELSPNHVMKKLQKSLPNGLKILHAESISTKDISPTQKLKAAIWSFKLTTISSQNKVCPRWEEGISQIMSCEELIWQDTDKRGRFRKRNFKHVLKCLKIEKSIALSPFYSTQIKLESLIAQNGQSLKPLHIHHWIQEYLNQPLKISDIKRNELLLLHD